MLYPVTPGTSQRTEREALLLHAERLGLSINRMNAMDAIIQNTLPSTGLTGSVNAPRIANTIMVFMYISLGECYTEQGAGREAHLLYAERQAKRMLFQMGLRSIEPGGRVR